MVYHGNGSQDHDITAVALERNKYFNEQIYPILFVKLILYQIHPEKYLV